MTYLTAPETSSAKKTYRYYVELHSLERDYLGVTEHRFMAAFFGGIIPPKTCLVDCVVTEPSIKAINQLLAAAGWMDGYKIAYCWVPAEDECPF